MTKFRSLQVTFIKGRTTCTGNIIEDHYKFHISNEVLFYDNLDKSIEFLNKFLIENHPLRVKPYGMATGILYDHEKPPRWKDKPLYLGVTVINFMAENKINIEEIDKEVILQKAVFRQADRKKHDI